MSSKLHKRVLRLLKEIFGPAIKEEVNVQKLFPNYSAHNQHFDIVIPSYNLVIECHGIQHRTFQSFGQKNTEEALQEFYRGQHRDRRKEEVVWENGWGYMVIWFDKLPTDDSEAKTFLKKKALEAIQRIDSE